MEKTLVLLTHHHMFGNFLFSQKDQHPILHCRCTWLYFFTLPAMMHPVSPPLLHLGKNDIDRCVPSSFTLTLRISACFAFKNVSDGLVCMGRSGIIPRPSRWYLQMRINISLVFHSCRLRNPTAQYMLSALFSWRKHLLRMDWTMEWEKDAPENTLRFLYGNWHCFHHSSDALL